MRARVRGFIEELIRGELDAVLGRPRYGRGRMASDEGRAGIAGHRHGSRTRTLTGTFGPVEIAVPRARLNTPDGKTTEWKSQALRAYQRRTLAADALIASAYLAGTNTRRVRRALAALFGGAVGKDTVSRVWRKVKSDWDAWNARSLAAEPIVRLILDGTVVRVRLDRKATSISLLVVMGVREDGQKVLLAVKSMGGESSEAWRAVLDDLIKRGLRRPEFLIVDGAPGLDKAIAAVWEGVPVQRCTVHEHRNLLAHAPERLHEEITNDYNDMTAAHVAPCVCFRGPRGMHRRAYRHRGVWGAHAKRTSSPVGIGASPTKGATAAHRAGRHGNSPPTDISRRWRRCGRTRADRQAWRQPPLPQGEIESRTVSTGGPTSRQLGHAHPCAGH